MEFKVKKSELLRELGAVQSAVERKTTLPILSNILLEAKDGALSISATDLDISLRTTCPASIVSDGTMTVPALKFIDHLKLLQDDVHITLAENHWLHVKSGRSKTKMIGMAPKNFPKLPELPAKMIQIPIPEMQTLIRKIAFSISNEESRYILNGALFVIKPDGLLIVATDGHRLGHCVCTKPIAVADGEMKVLLPI